jgi:hypothetical protein
MGGAEIVICSLVVEDKTSGVWGCRLALCNLPKAAEAITEVTSNHFESWI